MRYDYRCNECDSVFELRRPMEEAGAPAVCPNCGHDAGRLWTVPHMIVRGATTKNRDPKDYQNLMPVPRAFDGMSPRKYERMHAKNFAENEKLAREIANQRSISGTPDGALRKVGQMSFQEYLAMKRDHTSEFADGNATPSRDLLERRGCIYKHEVGKGKKDS